MSQPKRSREYHRPPAWPTLETTVRSNPLKPFLVPAVVRSKEKRIFDIVVVVLVSTVALPLMALIALLVRLDSRGSIFFWQERVGFGGQKFRMLKFRTMRADASESRHRDYVMGLVNGKDEQCTREGVFKLVDDDRVTAVGRILRKTSLDELPQLWNIMKGEMSLVGPRPPVPYEVEEYEEWQLRRLMVRPGVTGLWQVSGRNRLTYRRMCELDLDYIARWTFRGDLAILLKTIPVVLTNSGSAH